MAYEDLDALSRMEGLDGFLAFARDQGLEVDDLENSDLRKYQDEMEGGEGEGDLEGLHLLDGYDACDDAMVRRVEEADRLRSLLDFPSPPFPSRNWGKGLYSDVQNACQRKLLEDDLWWFTLRRYEDSTLVVVPQYPENKEIVGHPRLKIIRASALLVIETDAWTSPLARADLLNLIGGIERYKEFTDGIDPVLVSEVLPAMAGGPHGHKEIIQYLNEPFTYLEDHLFNLKPAWRLWASDGTEQVGFVLCDMTIRHQEWERMGGVKAWRDGVERMGRKLAEKLGGRILDTGSVIDPVSYGGIVRIFHEHPITLDQLFFPHVYEIHPEKLFGTSRHRRAHDDPAAFESWREYVKFNTWLSVRLLFEERQKQPRKSPEKRVTLNEIRGIAYTHYESCAKEAYVGRVMLTEQQLTVEMYRWTKDLYERQDKPSRGYKKSVQFARKGGLQRSPAKKRSSRANLVQGRAVIETRRSKRVEDIREKTEEGMTAVDIADELGISVSTVRRDRARARK